MDARPEEISRKRMDENSEEQGGPEKIYYVSFKNQQQCGNEIRQNITEVN